MTKLKMLAAVGVTAFMTACASAQGDVSDTRQTAQASTTTQQQMAPASPSAITDEQLRTYAAIQNEIAPLQASLATQTPEQQAQTSRQISAVLARHNMAPATFNAIARMANEDREFAARLATAQPDTFSDQTLNAFAAASIEIDPITQTLATATPEQQAQATEQIRQILARNSIDSATYNAIASRAQADAAFAERIQVLNRQAQAADDSSGNGE